MTRVRMGIIGLGNIGVVHARHLATGFVPGADLTAIATSKGEAARSLFPAAAIYPDGASLLSSGKVDAVIIATPHWQHVRLGMAAFERGIHVLMEKPLAAHKADAERLLACHALHPELTFATMLQLRCEPRFQALRDLILARLGPLVRVNWIITDWYRTHAYYRSSGWRATWKGEGGGVLINQCLHNLDMLQWLCGMPLRVRGFCQMGRFHPIEVEDQVTAYFEWANRATGSMVTSTGEAPGTNRLEIVGTQATAILEGRRLVCKRNEMDMQTFSQKAKTGFEKPETITTETLFPEIADLHAQITANFVKAILEGQPLIAPANQGIHSLELANAITYSSLLDRTLELPLDGQAWEKHLLGLFTH